MRSSFHYSQNTVRGNILTSQLLDERKGVRFAFSTRHGGVSAVPYGMNTSYRVGDVPESVTENRARLFRRLGIHEGLVAVPRQCHSAEVRVVTRGGPVEQADGLLTAVPGVWLSVSVADCVPVFLVDTQGKAIGAVHAGWRGSGGMITEQAVRKMRDVFGTDPEALLAFVGPSAGSCCYEVGPEVAEQFDPSVLVRRNGSQYLDLKKENTRQLLSAGVKEEHIEVSKYCTVCTPEMFHSFRRDKERSGRMMGILGIIREGA